MYSPLTRRHSCSWLLTLLFFFTGCFAVQAQGGVGSTRGLPESSGGTNVIQGRVFFPDGQPGSKRLRVNLESTDEPSKSSQTDEDGTFRFNGLKPGSYTVIVEGGKEYETARESVFFEGSRHNTIVPIYLKSKAATAALAKIPRPARDAYAKGTEAAGKGDSRKAAELLEQAVNLYPEFPQALSDLGLQYMKLGEMGKAVDTYQALLKLNPTDAMAQLNLGIALFNLSGKLLSEKKSDESNQKLGQAEQTLRQAIIMKVPGPNAHYYLALTLIRLRKYSEAQTEMELAIANGGDSLALAHKYLGGLYMSAKRHKDAADHLERYLLLDPKAKDADQIRGTIKELRAKQ